MFENCLEKQNEIVSQFTKLKDKEERFNVIISFANKLIDLPPNQFVEKNLVTGCQSKMYLYTYLEEGRVYFAINSDAIISKGLAGLLSYVYSGEPLEAIFKCPPDFLQKIDLFSAISMNRSNGVKSLFLKMQQQALQLLAKG